MEDKRCPNKAAYVYPWGGKLMKGCEQHMQAMTKIGDAIGSPLEVQLYSSFLDNEMCMHKDDLGHEGGSHVAEHKKQDMFG